MTVQSVARWGDQEERFWRRIDVAGPDECWLWTGPVNHGGYGAIYFDGSRQSAHRVSFQLAFGPVPNGLDIDHQCHNVSDCPGGPCAHRRCVNPAHLRAVTRSENLTAGRTGEHTLEECQRGHAFTPENTYIGPRGRRECRACRYAAVIAHRQRTGGGS